MRRCNARCKPLEPSPHSTAFFLPVFPPLSRGPRPGIPRAERAAPKATKKTDKPRPEDLDVTQLTPEELKDELMKYGFQPGPVVSSTRKLYEKKLQKLLDEGPLESQPAPPAPAPAADNNQNGNTDSDQYSDKEQEEMPKPVLEKREPLKSKAKPPASLRTRRLEQKRSMSVLRSVEQEQEEEAVSAVGFLNVKRRSRAVQQDQAVPGSDDTDLSELSAPENLARESRDPGTPKRGAQKSQKGKVSDSPRSNRKTRVEEIPEPLVVRRVRDVSMGFGSNKLPHIQPQPIQPPNESRAGTPRKLSTHNKESEEEGWRDTIETPPARQTKIPRPAPVALLDTALLEEDLLERMTEDAKDTPKQKIRQQKIFAFLKPVKPQVEGRIAGGDYVEQTQEKDILEEMFPNQVATPTGISATCRRPIRGAAGRPLDSSSFRLDDSLLLLSQTSYRSNLRTESFKPASPAFTAAKTNSNSSTSSSASGSAPSRRSFPVWIQLLLLSLVAGFLFFIYQAMETNHMNPFTQDAPAASTPQVQDQ
ncbi:lamina-associated polypeptide 2, isoforms beta/delta/epsilon/gamma-like isoform X3 [Polyodon spathula]|uniref:lamina-associated polypeptide 2, isoforms beta/delta/epsilon/gamma-like isoform X3 n=1 Tax=Polyodon spathula TaxID=7913 RepID=UPI001B7DB616|nr:lamina-associated polypeptide 2, isoforms beta/delta/epsilon/gamma-like isoform X3 [Polyodon spathula]